MKHFAEQYAKSEAVEVMWAYGLTYVFVCALLQSVLQQGLSVHALQLQHPTRPTLSLPS
jgi:hypothetical protein